MKKGLVMEGGAMRGMYTAGVLDVMLENDIQVDGAIGVSAGAVFGCNYKSKQIGRTIRYNKRFCNDPRYSGIPLLIKTGNIFGEEFCYDTIPNELDIFDTETYVNNPVKFYVTCTDVHTGEAVYQECPNGDAEDIQWMRASASMPLVSHVVSVGGREMLDGGVADSIPIRWFCEQGYEKNIVILTRPAGYRKSPNKMMPLMKLALKKYPKIIETMKNRHLNYNESLDKVYELEKEGKVFLMQPSRLVKVSKIEKDPEKLEALYQLGREDALKRLDAMKEFLNQ